MPSALAFACILSAIAAVVAGGCAVPDLPWWPEGLGAVDYAQTSPLLTTTYFPQSDALKALAVHDRHMESLPKDAARACRLAIATSMALCRNGTGEPVRACRTPELVDECARALESAEIPPALRTAARMLRTRAFGRAPVGPDCVEVALRAGPPPAATPPSTPAAATPGCVSACRPVGGAWWREAFNVSGACARSGSGALVASALELADLWVGSVGAGARSPCGTAAALAAREAAWALPCDPSDPSRPALPGACPATLDRAAGVDYGWGLGGSAAAECQSRLLLDGVGDFLDAAARVGAAPVGSPCTEVRAPSPYPPGLAAPARRAGTLYRGSDLYLRLGAACPEPLAYARVLGEDAWVPIGDRINVTRRGELLVRWRPTMTDRAERAVIAAGCPGGATFYAAIAFLDDRSDNFLYTYPSAAIRVDGTGFRVEGVESDPRLPRDVPFDCTALFPDAGGMEDCVIPTGPMGYIDVRGAFVPGDAIQMRNYGSGPLMVDNPTVRPIVGLGYVFPKRRDLVPRFPACDAGGVSLVSVTRSSPEPVEWTVAGSAADTAYFLSMSNATFSRDRVWGTWMHPPNATAGARMLFADGGPAAALWFGPTSGPAISIAWAGATGRAVEGHPASIRAWGEAGCNSAEPTEIAWFVRGREVARGPTYFVPDAAEIGGLNLVSVEASLRTVDGGGDRELARAAFEFEVRPFENPSFASTILPEQQNPPVGAEWGEILNVPDENLESVTRVVWAVQSGPAELVRTFGLGAVFRSSIAEFTTLRAEVYDAGGRLLSAAFRVRLVSESAGSVPAVIASHPIVPWHDENVTLQVLPGSTASSYLWTADGSYDPSIPSTPSVAISMRRFEPFFTTSFDAEASGYTIRALSFRIRISYPPEIFRTSRRAGVAGEDEYLSYVELVDPDRYRVWLRGAHGVRFPVTGWNGSPYASWSAPAGEWIPFLEIRERYRPIVKFLDTGHAPIVSIPRGKVPEPPNPDAPPDSFLAAAGALLSGSLRNDDPADAVLALARISDAMRERTDVDEARETLVTVAATMLSEPNSAPGALGALEILAREVAALAPFAGGPVARRIGGVSFAAMADYAGRLSLRAVFAGTSGVRFPYRIAMYVPVGIAAIRATVVETNSTLFPTLLGPSPVSVAVTVEVYAANGTLLSMNGVTEGFLIAVPASSAGARCAWFDRARSVWTGDGCATGAFNGTHYPCTCTHLTTFSAVVGAEATPTPTPTPSPTPSPSPSASPYASPSPSPSPSPPEESLLGSIPTWGYAAAAGVGVAAFVGLSLALYCACARGPAPPKSRVRYRILGEIV